MHSKGKNNLSRARVIGKRILIALLLFFSATVVPALIFGGPFFISALFDRTLPTISFVDPSPGIGNEPTTVTFDIGDAKTGLGQVLVKGIENSNVSLLFSRKYPHQSRVNKDTISVPFDGKRSGFSEGYVSLLVTVIDRSVWKNKKVKSLLLKVDYESPQIRIISDKTVSELGGVELVFYRVEEQEVITSGLKNGSDFHLGYQAKELDNAFAELENVYFSFFPIGYFGSNELHIPQVVAVDAVGNSSKINLPITLKETKNYGNRVLQLNGAKSINRINTLYLDYLTTKKIGEDPSIGFWEPAEQLAFRYKKLKNDYQSYWDSKLSPYFKKTEHKRLWEGDFLSFAGDIQASFGDTVNVFFDNSDAGQSVSLGVTWFNLKDLHVRAANSGKVVFAGPMGTYGNTVIIDHGFGLSSLYAHLDRVSCRENESVSKSTVIGEVGSTGLATKNILFYQMRMNGVPIDPEPWWNTQWVMNEIGLIKRRLGLLELNSFRAFDD